MGGSLVCHARANSFTALRSRVPDGGRFALYLWWPERCRFHEFIVQSFYKNLDRIRCFEDKCLPEFTLLFVCLGTFISMIDWMTGTLNDVYCLDPYSLLWTNLTSLSKGTPPSPRWWPICRSFSEGGIFQMHSELLLTSFRPPVTLLHFLCPDWRSGTTSDLRPQATNSTCLAVLTAQVV